MSPYTRLFKGEQRGLAWVGSGQGDVTTTCLEVSQVRFGPTLEIDHLGHGTAQLCMFKLSEEASSKLQHMLLNSNVPQLCWRTVTTPTRMRM